MGAGCCERVGGREKRVGCERGPGCLGGAATVDWNVQTEDCLTSPHALYIRSRRQSPGACAPRTPQGAARWERAPGRQVHTRIISVRSRGLDAIGKSTQITGASLERDDYLRGKRPCPRKTMLGPRIFRQRGGGRKRPGPGASCRDGTGSAGQSAQRRAPSVPAAQRMDLRLSAETKGTPVRVGTRGLPSGSGLETRGTGVCMSLQKF